MRLLFTFARAYPWRTALTFSAVILAGLSEGLSLGTVLPLLAEAGGEEGAGGRLGELLSDGIRWFGLEPEMGVLLVIIVCGLAIKSGFMLLASRQVGYTVAHVATDLRLKLIRSLLSTRWEYYIHLPVGAIANAAGSEAMRSSMAYQSGVTVVSLTFQALVFAGVAFVMSPEATLAALAAGAVILFSLDRLVRVTRRAGTQRTEHMRTLVTRLTDHLQSVKPLRSMGREDLADVLLIEDNRRLNEAVQSYVVSKEALKAIQEPLITIFLMVGLFVALEMWGLPLATVAVLVILMSKIMNRMGKVQRQLQQAAGCESAYYSLLGEIRAADEAREPRAGSGTAHLQREIRFQDVSFAYDERPIFERLDLDIPAGRIISIEGPSGQGKTTLIDLVTGLLRPDEGEVLVDGKPLGEIDLLRWRRKIGYVPQDTILLHGSILMNVTLGDPELTSEDAERALHASGSWAFVSALPEGMETSVGERGAKLSGGQRQRIAIARALVHRPELLILDEATSALDPTTAAAICETLRDLRGELTILAISHQSVLTEVSDLVYRLRDGGVTREERTVELPARPAPAVGEPI